MVKPVVRRVIFALVLQSVEAFLALLCLLAAVPVLFGNFTPDPIAALLPDWLVLVWSIALLVGGVATLGGIMSGSFAVERIGVAVLWGISIVYGLALIDLLPSSAIAMLTYFLFALAMAARHWVLGRLLKMDQNLFELRVRLEEYANEIGR